jgi:hypothetical protein
MPEDQLDLLVAYLRQHGDRFAVDALRQQMLSEGHDPALVEEAIVVYQREKPAPPARPVWPRAVGIAFLNLAVVILVIGLVIVFEAKIPYIAVSSLFLLLAAALILEPVVGAVLILAGGPRRRPGMALLLGWVLFAGATLLLLGGFCLFLMANGY